jgi:hypothetical protein
MNQNQVLLCIIDEEVCRLYLRFYHLILVDKFQERSFDKFFLYILIRHKLNHVIYYVNNHYPRSLRVYQSEIMKIHQANGVVHG